LEGRPASGKADAGYRTIRVRNETIVNPRADLLEMVLSALKLERTRVSS
jgi:hypothetical protein